MKTSHGVIQGYNGMAITDSKRQIVVKAEAFGSGQEHELLQPMIEGAKDNAEAIGLGEEYFKDKKVIGDTGSYSSKNLEYLSEENIDGYIPDHNFRQRDPRFKDRDRFKNKKNSLYSKEDFIYRKESDDFVCPEGNILEFKHKRTVKNTYGGRQYNAEEKDCSKCTQRNKCLRKDKAQFRTLYIMGDYLDRNYLEEMKVKIDSPLGRDIYSRRMGIIEPVFGNIQYAKQLNRFTLRTKAKVNIQWMLFCIIHNIEKIFKYGDYKKSIVAPI